MRSGIAWQRCHLVCHFLSRASGIPDYGSPYHRRLDDSGQVRQSSGDQGTVAVTSNSRPERSWRALTLPHACQSRVVGGLRQNRPVTTQVSFKLGASHRDWLILRRSDNPFAATGGPLPQIAVPIEARVTDRDIAIEILRLAFDLKIGSTLVGQGEIGPYTYLHTEPTYLQATATCPQTALSHLVNPEPPQGRITLNILLKGLLRYQHSFPQGDGRAQGLGEPDTWHIETIGNQSLVDLDIQVARSDWYEQVVEKLGVGSYLITPLYLPYGMPSWESTLGHMNAALRALVQGNSPGVFGECRAAIDALPGAKTGIFAAMPEGKKRDAIDELTKSVGKYIHSGRHVVPNTGGEQAGEFPADLRDALFAYNMTKLLLSQIASLTLTS
jgi:hypothetical protein